MSEIRSITNLSVGAETDAVIIGGGVMGTVTALELARRGHAVEVFDKLSLEDRAGNASYAGGSEFLPFVFGENPTLHTANARERLPFQISYLLCTLQGFSESREYYRRLLPIEGSGVSDVQLIEPFEPSDPGHVWQPFLESLMEPQRRVIGRAVYLENGLGDSGRYTDYYDCKTLAIDSHLTLPYLRSELCKYPGVRWHDNSHVTKEALESFGGLPVVIAAGSETPLTHKKSFLPVYNRVGMSARFRSSVQLPASMPMVSFDDFLLAPHDDGYGFNAGGLDLANYNHDEGLAAETILRRVRELSKIAIGPWEGISTDILDGCQYRLRTGTRPMGMQGLRVEQGEKSGIISIEDSGSIGWVLAPYAGRLAADFVVQIMDSVKKGAPRNDLLLERAPSVYVPRTLMDDIWHNPSQDVLEWRDPENGSDFRDLMRAIAGFVIEETEVQLGKASPDAWSG